MERDAFNIIEFSSAITYPARPSMNSNEFGQRPGIMRVGSRRMISREAAADWRREREAVPAAGGKAS